MTKDARTWFSSATGRRITAVEIADHLDVTRNTVNRRLAEGLPADDIIKLSRALDVSPIRALVDLDYLTNDEAMDYLDGDGTLLATGVVARSTCSPLTAVGPDDDCEAVTVLPPVPESAEQALSSGTTAAQAATAATTRVRVSIPQP